MRLKMAGGLFNRLTRHLPKQKKQNWNCIIGGTVTAWYILVKPLLQKQQHLKNEWFVWLPFTTVRETASQPMKTLQLSRRWLTKQVRKKQTSSVFPKDQPP